MYNPRLNRWKNPKATEGLLLFAQRAQECLFDYALDSYKAPALNTHSRCEELRQVVKDVAEGRVTAGNLKPVVEELAESVRTDIAAKSLLGGHADSLGNPTWWQIEKVSALRVQAEMLRSHLWKGAYERELILQIKERVQDGKRKHELLALTTSLVVEWIHAGFSRDYIYSATKRFFFGIGGATIDSHEVLDGFVQLFERKKDKKTYEVLLRVSSAWSSILKEVIPAEAIQLYESAPPHRRGYPKERQFLNQDHDGVYLVIKDIKAFDPSRARMMALDFLSTIADLGTCHSHKSPLSWKGDALIWEGTHPTWIREPLRAIHKEDECSVDELPKRFASTLANLGPARLNESSWSRLAASLALHSAAVRAQDVSVQLSSLWAAMEAMLPAQADESKIVSIKNALVPILSRHYVRKLLADLLVSLRRCCEKELLQALDSLVPKRNNELHGLAAILAIDANEPLRDLIYVGLDKNPLLRNRVFSLRSVLSSPKSILDLIKTHSCRVDWHIQRIYRSRNLLIHAGKKTNVVDSLVENLHSYFHALLTGLEGEFGMSPPASEIDAALLRLRQEHENHCAFLTTAGSNETTDESLLRAVFG